MAFYVKLIQPIVVYSNYGLMQCVNLVCGFSMLFFSELSLMPTFYCGLMFPLSKQGLFLTYDFYSAQ